MEDKIDAINKKINFIVFVIVAQIILGIGSYFYYTQQINGVINNATDNVSFEGGYEIYEEGMDDVEYGEWK